jgi:hypothetical protein
VNIQDAIHVIESVSGFTDESAPVGEAWLEVLSFIHCRLAAQPEPVSPTDCEIEEAAKLIYASMSFVVPDYYCPPPLIWVERGNSLMQDEARRTARAVLARWGRPTPPAPEPVEVAELGELIAWLHDHALNCRELGRNDWAAQITSAATLLQQLSAPTPPAPNPGEVAELVAWLHGQDGGREKLAIHSRIATLLQQPPAPAPAVVPVAVSERLPEPNIKVLAYYVNSLGKGRTICAIWVPAKTRSGRYGEDDFTEYDEETDKFYWPEGWYEQIENWEDLGWVKVYEGEVVYWQPLPKWLAHATPQPQGGEVEG